MAWVTYRLVSSLSLLPLMDSLIIWLASWLRALTSSRTSTEFNSWLTKAETAYARSCMCSSGQHKQTLQGEQSLSRHPADMKRCCQWKPHCKDMTAAPEPPDTFVRTWSLCVMCFSTPMSQCRTALRRKFSSTRMKDITPLHAWHR